MDKNTGSDTTAAAGAPSPDPFRDLEPALDQLCGMVRLLLHMGESAHQIEGRDLYSIHDMLAAPAERARELWHAAHDARHAPGAK